MPITGELAALRVNIQTNAALANLQIQRTNNLLGLIASNTAPRAGAAIVSSQAKSKQSILGTVASVYGLIAATRMMGGALMGAVKASAEIEDGFLFVERIQPGMREFRSETLTLARDLSRIDIAQLQKAEQAAARLGLRGKEVLGFAEVIAKLAQVTGGSAETLSRDFGKIIAIHGFEDKVQAVTDLGNAFLWLDVNTSAVLAEIANVSKRIGGFAQLMGMSAVEVGALAATSVALGQRVELTASSLVRFQTAVLTHQELIQKTFGMTNKQMAGFQSLMKEDVSSALMFILEQIKVLDSTAQQAIMGAFEISGFRAMPVLVTMAQRTNDFKDAILGANAAARDRNELEKQYAITTSGTGGILEDISEQWKLTKAAYAKGKGNDLLNAWKQVLRENEIGGMDMDDSRSDSFFSTDADGKRTSWYGRFANNLFDFIQPLIGGARNDLFDMTEAEMVTRLGGSPAAFQARKEQRLREKPSAVTEGKESDLGMEHPEQTRQRRIREITAETTKEFNLREEFRDRQRLQKEQFAAEKNALTSQGGTMNLRGAARQISQAAAEKVQNSQLEELKEANRLTARQIRLEEEIRNNIKSGGYAQ